MRLAALLLLAACAAPSQRAATPVAPAPPTRHGDFAVDASGRWLPTELAAARLTSVGGVDLLALDASPAVTGVVVRHAGPLRLGATPLSPAAGTTLLAFDAEGRWIGKAPLPGANLEVLTLRAGDDGTLVVGGRGLGGHQTKELGDHSPIGDSAAFFYTYSPAQKEGYVTMFLPSVGGMVTAVYPLDREHVLFAGESVPSKRLGPEPFQGLLGRFERRAGQRAQVATARQGLGGDHGFRVEQVEPGPRDWTFYFGDYQGEFGGGGKAALVTTTRTAFVAALDDEGHTAWILALPSPAADEVRVRAAAVDDSGMHMLIGGRGERTTLTAVHGNWGLVVESSCALIDAPAASEIRSVDLGGENIAVVGGFPVDLEGEPRQASGAFFDARCRLLAHFDSASKDAPLLGIRFAGDHVVVVSGGPGSLELRWSAP